MDLPPGGDAVLFELPQSRWRYALPWTIHFFNSHQLFTATMLAIALAATGMSLYYGEWPPMLIVAEVVVLMPVAVAWMALVFYRSSMKYGGMLRADKNGLQHVARDGQGRYTEKTLWQWTGVSRIWFYKRFIAIGTINPDGDRLDIVLPTPAPSRCRSHLLHHWWAAAHGITPDMQPHLYSTEERAAVEEFIAGRFGRPDSIIHDKYLANLQIDIAVIAPTKARPYYTLCTIGAGAYRMQVAHGAHASGELENRAEYIIYLPPEWNVTGKGHWRKENCWPADLLRVFAQEPQLHETASRAGRALMFGERPAPSTDAMGMVYAHPLPDLQRPTRADLPTRYSIGFLQMVFTDLEETRLLQAMEPHGDNILKVLFRGGDIPKATSPEERAREYAEALLRHFRQVAPPAACLQAGASP